MDYAYLQYKKDNLMAVGGKFKRKKYLWNATDLMWDGDVNPEGFAAKYSMKNNLGKFYVGSGILVIDEAGGTSEDPLYDVRPTWTEIQKVETFTDK